MKREIKFRCWDKDSSQMVYQEDEVGAQASCRDFYFDFTPDNIELLAPIEDDFPEVRDVEIMQFSGFKDRELKDIYESDILEICIFMSSPSNPDDDHHYRGVVIYENGMFQIDLFKQMSRHTDGKWVNLDFRCGFYIDSIIEEGKIKLPIFYLLSISGNLGEYNHENVNIVGDIFQDAEILNYDDER